MSIEQFVRALAFNWVVYGPDAHAKNYSLLLSGSRVFLAPLYDISSVVSYSDRYDLRTMTMAMSVNGKYQNTLVTGDDWAALASAISVDAAVLLTWVRDVVENVTASFAEVIAAQEPWIQELDMTASLQAGVERSAAFMTRFL